MIDQKEFAKQLREPSGANSKLATDFMAKANLPIYQFALKHLRVFSHLKLLEVGMANGVFTETVFNQEPTMMYSGIDMSDDMVREAKENNSSAVTTGKVQFLQGNLVALPFEDGSFDSFLTINTHYFWSDPEKCRNEILRVLKKGGQFLICGRSAESMQKLPFSQYDFKLYSEVELAELMSGNDLSSFRIEKMDETVSFPDGTKGVLQNLCAIGVKA
jgi:ubiquinone/menaquinone biosynthesis C-methylase UbiE